MNLEVMRETDEVRVTYITPAWQRVWTVVSPLLFGGCLLTFYNGDRLASPDFWISLPQWVRPMIYIGMAVLWLLSLAAALKMISVGQTEWIFRAGQAHMARHYVFNLKPSTSSPLDVQEISLHARRLDGPDLFRLDVHFGDGQKLVLPWTRVEGERDSLAGQLSRMFPQAEIDGLTDRQPDHHRQ